MPVSRSRRSKRSGGGWLGGLSPAPVGGRRRRRTRRGGMYALSPAPIGSLSANADTDIPSFGIAGQGFNRNSGGPQITATTAGGYRRSRRGGALPELSSSPFPPEGNIGYNGIGMPVGAGSAALSGGRRRRSRRR